MKNNLVVPLLELQEHTDNIRLMNLQIPGVDVERLNVDVTRLQKAMHWGGIRFLAIGSFEGEESEITSTGVRQNLDGTFSMTGQKIAKKTKMSEPSSQDLSHDYDYRWRNTSVYFNSTAIDEISDGRESNIIEQLDKSFRSALKTDVLGNEVSPRRFITEIGIAAVAATAGEIIEVFGLSPLDLSYYQWFLYFALPKLPLPLISKIRHANDLNNQNINPEIKPKYSTMFEWKFDRALLAARHLSKKIISESNI